MTEAWIHQVERIAFATFERGKRIVGVTSPQGGSGVTSLCETT
jgi:hypothetical protein